MEPRTKSIIDRMLDKIAAAVARRVGSIVRDRTEEGVLLYPQTRLDIHTVYVHEGEVVTIFAGPARRRDNDPPYEQIEVYVKDGKVHLDSDVSSEPWEDDEEPALRANEHGP